jgi:DNA-binding transcriptional regulator LsrR (DeoR family)
MNTKLKEEDVREIRRLYVMGHISRQELGLRFGVSRQVVSRVIRRETWKYVD